MKNIIDGKQTNDAFHTVQGPFSTYPITLNVSRVDETTLRKLDRKVSIPSLDERLAILKSYQNYKPEPEIVDSYIAITGKPFSWLLDRLEQSKLMVQRFLQHDFEDTIGSSTFIALPPNDPREIPYAIMHAMAAGSRLIIKGSSREPVLLQSIFNHLNQDGLFGSFVDLIYGDSTQDSHYLAQAARLTEKKVIMGDAELADSIRFHAERTRALVTDPEIALEHLVDSLQTPDSCLSVRTIVVLQKAYQQLMFGLGGIYGNLVQGTLEDPKTTLSLIPKPVRKEAAEKLLYGQATDTIDILYPHRDMMQPIQMENTEKGVIVQAFSGDPSIDPSPLLWGKVPEAYITVVLPVPSINVGILQLERMRKTMDSRSNGLHSKSMVLGIYGELPNGIEDLAYHVAHNQPTTEVGDGRFHQGIDLCAELGGKYK